MARTTRRLLLGALACAAALSLFAAPVGAITYGQFDGNRHPNVGALVGTFDGETFPFCSGTLISPTVFLTAAHCDVGADFDGVTFDPTFGSDSKILTGTFIAYEGYNQSQRDPLDLAVVVLDRPVKGIKPAQLPTLNLLDRMKADGSLNQSTRFTVVGYGGQEPLNQPGGPVIGFLDQREFAVASFNSLGPGYLRLSQNNAHGDGGACYGDSGGPNFLGTTNIIVGTTITGDALCKSTNVTERLDTVAAREFLGRFVTLP